MFTIVRASWRWLIALAATAALVLAPTTSANAATIITFAYDASGTSHIAKTNSDVALGPTTLQIDYDADAGTFTGDLPLPGTSTRFKLAGFLPVTADVDFEPAGPVTGRINFLPTSITVTSTAKYYVRLSNIRIVGFPAFAGPNCRTIAPVTIPANTPEGEAFDLLSGGRLTGTYSIGRFERCGLNTPLINAVVPGPNNTLDLNLSNGRVVS